MGRCRSEGERISNNTWEYVPYPFNNRVFEPPTDKTQFSENPTGGFLPGCVVPRNIPKCHNRASRRDWRLPINGHNPIIYGEARTLVNCFWIAVGGLNLKGSSLITENIYPVGAGLGTLSGNGILRVGYKHRSSNGITLASQGGLRVGYKHYPSNGITLASQGGLKASYRYRVTGSLLLAGQSIGLVKLSRTGSGGLTSYGDAIVPWKPLFLSSLALWLDANDSTTLFQDSGRTTAATANGDPVGGWSDKSTLGNHETQTTASNCPVLKTNSINGLPTVEFDGVDDFLCSGSITSLNNQFDVVMVYRALITTSSSGTRGHVCFFSSTEGGDAGAMWCGLSETLYGGRRFINTGVVQPIGNYIGGFTRKLSTGCTFWDSAIPFYDDNGTGPNQTSNFVRVGGSNRMNYMNMRVGELVVTPSISSTERALLEKYLRDKWNINRTRWIGGLTSSGSFGLKAKYRYVVTGGLTASGSSTVPFTPLYYSPKLWLDASDATTLFQDSSRTTAVSANADPVGGWADKSGNSNNGSQATASLKPTYRTSVQSSRSTVRFDGADDYMTLGTGMDSSSTTPVVLVVVTKGTTRIGGTFDSAPGQGNVFRTGSDISGSQVEAWLQSPVASLPITTAATVWAATLDFTPNRLLKTYCSGNLIDSQTGNTTGIVFGGPQIGRINTNLWRLNGDIAELLVYRQSLSSSQLSNLLLFLQNKWGAFTVSGTGGALLSNQAGLKATYRFLPTGGITASNRAVLRMRYNFSGAGSLISSGSATVPWIPLYLSSVKLWLDASDTSTLFQDSSRTIAASSTGDPVGGWKDKSNSGTHASQTTSSMRPTRSSVTGGMLSVLADGIDDFFQMPADSLNRDRTDPYTVGLVYRRLTNNAQVFPIVNNTSPPYTGVDFQWQNNRAFFVKRANNNVYVLSSYFDDAALNNQRTVIFIDSGTSTGSGLSCYSQGQSQSLTVNSDTLTTGSSIASPSVPLLFKSQTNYGWANWHLHEVIWCNAALTSTEISNLHNYWKSKWWAYRHTASGGLTTGGQATVPFTPTFFQPTLWLDANDSATLFQDSGLTTAASLNADPIGGWKDKSGNNNNATQSTSSKRPTLRTAVQSSKPTIRGDGVDDMLSLPFAASAPLTVYAIWNQRQGSGSFSTLLGVRDLTQYPPNYWDWNILRVEREVRDMPTVVAGRDIVRTTRLGTTFWQTTVQEKTDKTGQMWDNGVSIGTGVAVSSYTSRNLSIYTQNGSDGSNGYFNGDLAELIIYAAEHDATRRAIVETYLKNKWGVYALNGSGGMTTGGSAIAKVYVRASGSGGIVTSNSAVVPFLPYYYQSLNLWLDASDSTTLFQDSAKTTPATVDGDPVGGWSDKSTVAGVATQTTSSKRPLLKLSQQNSLPGIKFDGVDDWLITNSVTFTTIYMVGKITSAGSYWWDGRDSGIANGYFFSGSFGSAISDVYLHGTRDMSSGHYFTLTSAIDCCAVLGSSGTSNLHWMDRYTEGLGPTAGFLYEIIAYNTSHDASMRSNVFSYLQRKWAIRLARGSGGLTTGGSAVTKVYLRTSGTGGVVASNSATVPWSPLYLQSLALWLDANDSTTLFQDSSRTTAATLDGDPIGGWSDKSTLGNHLLQALSNSARPTLKTSALNSKKAIQWDGVDDYLSAASSASLEKTGTITILVVFRKNSTKNSALLYKSTNFEPSGYGLMSNWNWSSATLNGFVSSPIDKHDFALQPVTNTWYSIGFEFSGTTATSYVSGILDATSSGSYGLTANSSLALFLGSRWNGSSVADQCPCHIAELVICGALTATTRNLWFSYIFAKWGIYRASGGMTTGGSAAVRQF